MVSGVTVEVLLVVFLSDVPVLNFSALYGIVSAASLANTHEVKLADLYVSTVGLLAISRDAAG